MERLAENSFFLLLNHYVSQKLRSTSSLSSYREVSVIVPTVEQVLSTVQDSPLSICMPLGLGSSLVSPEIQAALMS